MNQPVDEFRGERSHVMTLRTRICIWIIIVGLANFVAYTMGYLSLGGDAMKGRIVVERVDGREVERHYLHDREDVEVSRGLWIYSAIHSVSIWITMGAVMLAMLTLAKDRIVSSMRSTIIHGRTLITMIATVVTLISILMTTWFLIYMFRNLFSPAQAVTP